MRSQMMKRGAVKKRKGGDFKDDKNRIYGASVVFYVINV